MMASRGTVKIVISLASRRPSASNVLVSLERDHNLPQGKK